MSLFIPYKDMWDMPLGGMSDEKQVPHWFGNAVYVVVGGLCKLLFRYRVDGRQNLRAFHNECGVLVVCNHTSFLDVAFIYLAARTKQWVRIIGRDTLFGNANGLLGQILSRVGAFPIKRDSADRVAIKRAARMLKNREIVGILPEGTRRGKGNLEPKLHSGAAFIARMGKAPILPMTVRDAEYVKQKGSRVHFPKITVEYSTPILLSDFDFLPKDERLDACSWYAMRECFALSRRIPAAEVDMVELFPDSKDYANTFAEHPIPKHTSEEVVALYKAQMSPRVQIAEVAEAQA
ncbi:1-acyl-sn-glycerol-3-phosphate acyltransferase [Adlercreutzia sp. ZJ154]|uniref:lysophospholipid acyltransferase family protein n=1 Tax=Adlercreutzia sp. ZJ154 TaxID=2709790 RepID=UPI0013EE3B52|nr:lysophospholipid acyltransferase family protein [Adlercreutzia sp. ZJ154]